MKMYKHKNTVGLATHLFVKVLRPGDSAVFESSSHLLLPV